jgi:hypothetical protein
MGILLVGSKAFAMRRPPSNGLPPSPECRKCARFGREFADCDRRRRVNELTNAKPLTQSRLALGTGGDPCDVPSSGDGASSRAAADAMKTPCRLFVIPARDVPVAVVFRRRPTDWYHVLLWHLTTDRFEHGAWMKGRIYESDCDISPDGKLLVTKIHKGSRAFSSYTSAWTAVSRAPWLHALTLWPMATTYGGGGRFHGPRQLVIRMGWVVAPHPSHPLGALEVSVGGALAHRTSGEVPDAEWSGRGQDGKLVFAREGKLFRRVGERDVLVLDLNELEPAPGPAPDWAHAPLEPIKGHGWRPTKRQKRR